MRRDPLQESLERGERLAGLFWPEGADEPTPGVVDWAPDRGAHLELITSVEPGGRPGRAWPRQLAGDTIAVHGSVRGFRISLLDTWVNRLELVDIPVSLHSSTIAIGDYCTSDTRWTRAVFSTANLSEWRADSGIRTSFARTKRTKYHTHVRWMFPTEDEVDLPEAKLSFGGAMNSTGVAFAPDWTIQTWQEVVVDPTEPLKADEFHRRYAQPLLAFTTFVSDRPDALTQEVLISADSNRCVVVLRQGQQVAPRPWRPDRAYLFPVAVLDNYEGSLNRWWEMHEQVWPALGLFASHIQEGNTYSPARFLTLFSGVEAYARARHGHKKLRRLREHAGVPNTVTGCTNDALGLIGVSRDYFAHFGHAGRKYSLPDVENNALESTRRLSALMQACLMRDLGIKAPDIAELLSSHYANWPIP